ncbi:Tuberculostearic acid methyltransferase UfaA1 [Paramyrothecium foliicola]|nr:Tuberculostearic acid methyltransferase UfaA1 [Paramyrothecium foliicola]
METQHPKPAGLQIRPSSSIFDLGSLDLANRLRLAAAGLLANQARSFVLAALHRIQTGQIILNYELQNETYTFGPRGGLTAALTVKNDNLWWRVAFDSSIGFAESYMLGEVDCSDLQTFLEIMIMNRGQTGDLSSLASFLVSKVAWIGRPSNDPAVSLSNVRAHYDISNSVFEAFLSPDMTYSCPLWLPKNNHGPDSDSLEMAQLRKLHDVINQAKIKQSDHVLEIGTGWGSFAIEAVKTTGCRVTSLTLSAEQKSEAEARIRAAGLEQHITVRLQDYRKLARCSQKFDKVVSIEMLEHVGKDHLAGYFGVVNEVLKRDGGIAVFQSSTMPETRYSNYDKSNDFIRKYIFPGAHVPSVTAIMEAAQVGSSGTLVPDRVLNLGGHYSRCLREWRQNFLANFESIIGPAMVSRNPDITASGLEQFRRKFTFYFAMCEAGFRTKTLGNALITLAREGTVETLEQIQL